MSKFKNRSNRRWLNTNKDATAFISWYIEKEFIKSRKNNKYPSIIGELSIADCNRKATLDFNNYGGSEKTKKRLLKKLSILEEEIKRFKEAFIHAHGGDL